MGARINKTKKCSPFHTRLVKLFHATIHTPSPPSFPEGMRDGEDPVYITLFADLLVTVKVLRLRVPHTLFGTFLHCLDNHRSSSALEHIELCLAGTAHLHGDIPSRVVDRFHLRAASFGSLISVHVLTSWPEPMHHWSISSSFQTQLYAYDDTKWAVLTAYCKHIPQTEFELEHTEQSMYGT